MVPTEETPPKTLYQYWDAETAWRCLESGTLAFTPPIRFDDPFDTNIAIRLELTEVDLREFYRRKDAIIIPVSEDAFVRDQLAEPNQAQRQVEATRDDFMESFLGVACFTEHKNDPRMWALYGQKHRGVMLGFDTRHSFFSGQFRKVDYSTKRPILTRLSEAPSMDQMKSKSEIWEWQREWRIVQYFSYCKTLMIGGVPIYRQPIPRKCLISITFGCRTQRDYCFGIKHSLAHWGFPQSCLVEKNRICDLAYDLAAC